MRTTTSGLAALVAAIGLVTCAAPSSPAQPAAGDKAAVIPEGYRGTWLLRLTSDDGGKTYRSGGGQAVCEVTETEVRFVRKVDFSPEKLVVKSVSKADANGLPTHTITFDGGVVWKVHDISGSITAVIHKAEKDQLTETYRITVRKQ